MWREVALNPNLVRLVIFLVAGLNATHASAWTVKELGGNFLNHSSYAGDQFVVRARATCWYEGVDRWGGPEPRTCGQTTRYYPLDSHDAFGVGYIHVGDRFIGGQEHHLSLGLYRLAEGLRYEDCFSAKTKNLHRLHDENLFRRCIQGLVSMRKCQYDRWNIGEKETAGSAVSTEWKDIEILNDPDQMQVKCSVAHLPAPIGD